MRSCAAASRILHTRARPPSSRKPGLAGGWRRALNGSPELVLGSGNINIIETESEAAIGVGMATALATVTTTYADGSKKYNI